MTESKNSAEENSEEIVRKLRLFRAGSRQFGIFVDEIATVAEWREPTPLPHAPKSVLGVVSLQGRMLTVLDLTALTNGQTASSKRSHQHIVSLRGDEQLALAVGALGETIEIAEGDLESGREATGSLIAGVINHNSAEINVLNLKQLFSSAIQGRERRRRRF
jgi:purine-binding chemotaxis protein CheW